MIKYILTDIDDVVLNWLEGFKDFLKLKNVTPVGEPKTWDLVNWVGPNAYDLIEEFNRSDAFGASFSWLTPTEGAVESLFFLKKRGYKIVAITSCGKENEEARLVNLNRIFGKDFFEAVHILELGECKKEILEKYPVSWWVEDNYKNALVGAEVGHYSFVVEQTYNIEFRGQDPNVFFVKNWWMIYDFIKNYEDESKIFGNTGHPFKPTCKMCDKGKVKVEYSKVHFEEIEIEVGNYICLREECLGTSVPSFFEYHYDRVLIREGKKRIRSCRELKALYEV